uniref:Putative ATPase domain containing protein n=1 Tax=viral metagenome TaxID=1070528 RepID=A0A6M3LPS7_9ZZZZ
MKNLDSNIDLSNIGACILIYADTDSGKTVSALTCEEPILFINTESKDPRLTHQQFDHKKKIRYIVPEGFNDFMDSMNEWITQYEAGKFPFKTLFLDGLTFAQSGFRKELEDSRYNLRLESDKDTKFGKGLIAQMALEQLDWGPLGSMMNRLMFLFNRFSHLGIVCIATAIAVHDTPKWGGGLRTAPGLIGKDFPKFLHGYFDFIGYIIEPFKYDEEKRPVFPKVSFHCQDEFGYMARSNINAVTEKGPAPLDFGKIMKVVRGA